MIGNVWTTQVRSNGMQSGLIERRMFEGQIRAAYGGPWVSVLFHLNFMVYTMGHVKGFKQAWHPQHGHYILSIT